MSRQRIVSSWLIVLAVSLLAIACGGGETEGDAAPTGATPGGEATTPPAPATPETEAAADGATESPATETAAAEAPEDVIPLRVTSLSFPSLVPVISEIIVAQGIDEAHGLDLTIEPFADIGAFYAALTTGQADVGVGGPTVLQNLVSEGADIHIVATFAGLEPLVVIAANPEVETLEDLRGRSLAATVGSAEYQTLAIYARSLGLDLETDVTLVNGSPADVRSQMEAGRVDAGMLWEPGASLALADSEEYRVILNGADAWEELTGERGWELVWAMQRSFTAENPEAPERWIAAQQEAVEWLFDNPEEAATIMEAATGMPPDAFQTVLEQGRVDYEVLPAWDPDVRTSIETHFEQAVDTGFLEELPGDDIFFDPGG